MKYFKTEQPMEVFYSTDMEYGGYTVDQFNEFRENNNVPTDFTFDDFKAWIFQNSLMAFNNATEKYMPANMPIIAFLGVYGHDDCYGIGLFDTEKLPEAIFQTCIKTMDKPEELTDSDVTVYINNGELFVDFERGNRTDMVMFRQVPKGVDALELCKMYGQNEITADDVYNYTEPMEAPVSKAYERMMYEKGE